MASIGGILGSILTMLGVFAFVLSLSGLVVLAMAGLKHLQKDRNEGL